MNLYAVSCVCLKINSSWVSSDVSANSYLNYYFAESDSEAKGKLVASLLTQNVKCEDIKGIQAVEIPTYAILKNLDKLSPKEAK